MGGCSQLGKNRPQMASGNVVFRGFTLFLHPGSCAPEGGEEGEKRREGDKGRGVRLKVGV